MVRSDHPDPSLWVHGVVADDLSEAVYTLAATATPVWSPPGRVRLPGLDAEGLYRLVPLAPADEIRAPGGRRLPWWDQGVELSGRALAVAGVQAPVLFPERLVLIQATRTNSATARRRR
ncbi:GH36 C-terminal domain-containing protein [Actinoplanes sp. CA-015351]|uniref:GH36 C-terminal domain-containing protein n=1 Tax=Actinoplanes sp. CA-015351 TaxID=3239897 RepID=UPI003D970416